jgi:uncharacterized protein YjdB
MKNERQGKFILGRLAVTTALVVGLCLAPQQYFAELAGVHYTEQGSVHAAQKFMATAQKASNSKVYIERGAAMTITGRYLAKGDKVTKYVSSNKAVATISSKGRLKARKVGSTTITLYTKKGQKDSIKVTVTTKPYPARKEFAITAKKSINVKQTTRLTVKAAPKTMTSFVKWYSYDKKIATVDAAGYITGKKVGKVKIRAKTTNGRKAYCVLTVKDPVTISKTSASLRMDRPEGLVLTATAPSGAVKWSSSNKAVATVDVNGVVMPVSPGTADITATSKASKTKATCEVTVVPHIKSTAISVTPTKKTIYAEQKTTLKATLTSAVKGQKSNDDITWKSSDKKIATVDSKGVVKGIGYGTATITAKAESGSSTTASITVKTVKAKLSKVILTPGMKYEVGFALYGSASSKDITYSSSDKTIATVSSSGTVSVNKRDSETGAAKAGTVTITAKTKAGDKATMKVVVRDEPTAIDVSKWQGDIDWETVSGSVDLVILRALYGSTTSTEPKYKSYATSCKKYGIPFGVYHYVTYKTKKAAESQAKAFYAQATYGGRAPLFYVIDAEESYITRANTEAYIAKLRSLAAADGIERLKIGVYVGHHLYNTLNLNLKTDTDNPKTPDFVWIPRYNSNIGCRTESMLVPDYACEMWQYSSTGGIPGISGNVDMNTLSHPDGEWLTTKSGFDFAWLIAGPDVG